VSAAPRILGFAVGCAGLFGVALGVGHATGPVVAEPAAPDHGEMSDAMPSTTHHDVGGLEATADGYTLRLAEPQLDAGRQRLAFTITGPDGAPVTAYDEEHEKELHLVVVRRDLTGFQHVHPELDTGTGEWSTDVELDAGPWRVVADVVPSGGEPQVLGADLMVAGTFTPEGLGPDSVVSDVDGYEVTLSRSTGAGGEDVLTTTVTKAGEPVTDLEPYLGAYGHLVALRDGDVGYLHVHPEDGPPGPAVAFGTSFPSPGRYRLFLDFRHDGVVHTATFTVTVDD
jgi:hypothetical protein